MTGSFLDFLLAGDTSGELHAIVDGQRADEQAGITWGLFDDDRLISTHDARFRAEYARIDEADASDRPVSNFEVRPVVDVRGEVAA